MRGNIAGGPTSAMNQALDARCTDLNRALDGFPLISAHDGLVILKYSISTPKLMYTLRCSPAFGHCLLDGFDRNLRLGLSRLANVQVDDLNWVQASLPVKDSGLWIRSVGLLAPSAFLASAAATHDPQAQFLPVGCPCDPYLDSAFDVWLGRYDSSEPQGTDRSKQRCWDQASVDHGLQVLEFRYSDPYHKARLLASPNPMAAIGCTPGLSLHAVCGWMTRRCVWPLVCALGLTSARNMTAPVVSRLTKWAVIDCLVVEVLAGYQDMMPSTTSFIVRSWKHKSPRRKNQEAWPEMAATNGWMVAHWFHGSTLIPWQRVRSMTWDVTIPDTLAHSHLPGHWLSVAPPPRKPHSERSQNTLEWSRDMILLPLRSSPWA